MSVTLIKQQAQAIIDICYKGKDKDAILKLTKCMREKVLDERRKYV